MKDNKKVEKNIACIPPMYKIIKIKNESLHM